MKKIKQLKKKRGTKEDVKTKGRREQTREEQNIHTKKNVNKLINRDERNKRR